MSRCERTGKVRHADRAAAEAVQAATGHKVKPYHCPDCDGWHLGGHHRRRAGDALAQFGKLAHPDAY